MEALLIEDLMTSSVSGITPDTPLRTVLRTMADKRHSCSIVTDKGEPAGIITERDIVRLMLKSEVYRDLLDWPAARVMSQPVLTVSAQDSLFDALVVAKTEQLRHLPVVDHDNRLCGIVTQSDLAAAHFHIVEQQSETIDRAIKEHTHELEQANRELQALSMEDALLHIGNRRAMEVDLNHTHAAALRYQRNYSIALVDVDYFKKYNDHYGHAAGDQALKDIASLFAGAMRASDRIYRYGGEELLILLADTGREGALIFIERMIKLLAERHMAHANSPYGFVTASAGVACAISDGECMDNWDMLVEKADAALYRAKNESRNTALAA